MIAIFTRDGAAAAAAMAEMVCDTRWAWAQSGFRTRAHGRARAHMCQSMRMVTGGGGGGSGGLRCAHVGGFCDIERRSAPRAHVSNAFICLGVCVCVFVER